MRNKLTTKEMNDRSDAIRDDILMTEEYLKICGSQVRLLLDMAINGDIPNGKFGDVEVGMWEIMREVLHNNEMPIRDI